MTAKWLGRVRHADAVAEMTERRAAVLGGDDSAQALLLCEHPPVITLGSRGQRSDVLASEEELGRRGVEIAETRRGGEVTYHCPGQLMIYPVVRLGRGIVALLESVGAELASCANALGVSGAEFRRSPAGVWVGEQKIAACGVHIRRRVAIHGFAFNLSTPSDAWQLIVPCGLPSGAIASVEDLGGESISARIAAQRFGSNLARAVENGAAIALR